MKTTQKELTNFQIFAPLVAFFLSYALKIGLWIWAFSENPPLAFCALIFLVILKKAGETQS